MPSLGRSGLSSKARHDRVVASPGRSARARSNRRFPMKHQGQLTSETMSMCMASSRRLTLAWRPVRMPGEGWAAKRVNVSSAGYSPGAGLYNAPHLARNSANFAALSPLAFLSRTAAVYPDKPAVIHGATRLTYRQFYQRCAQFADALRRRGIVEGDTVAVMAPNVPALLEAHYGV